MTQQGIIDQTINYLKSLPAEKAEEVLEFAEYIFKKNENRNLTKGIEILASQSGSFKFLENEEDLYSKEDIIEN